MSRLGLSLPASLERSLGQDGVVPEERLGDYSIDGVTPRVALRPTQRYEILEIVRFAAGNGLAIHTRGGGTQTGLGNIPQRYDLALDLTRYDKVIDYQPADLTATVEAGISLDSLRRNLASGGKTLPVEAPLASRATIGGVLAANSSGPMRAAFGLPRDWLIGISVVDGKGVETKSGGKVVKNVTGYDLGKLYAGSLGTLGVIVEATFKLNPLPQQAAALTAAFRSWSAAVQAARELSRQVYAPQGIQVLDRVAAGRLAGGTDSDDALLVAFLSGRSGAVRRQLAEVDNLLRDQLATVRQVADTIESRHLLREVTSLGWADGQEADLVLKASVPPSSVANMLVELSEAVASLEASGSKAPGPGVITDPAFGLVRILWWNAGGPNMSEDDAPWLVGVVGRLRQIALSYNGSLVVERAPIAVKQRIDVWGGDPEGIEIMRRIKAKLDPAGILNPGRNVGGI